MNLDIDVNHLTILTLKHLNTYSPFRAYSWVMKAALVNTSKPNNIELV